MEKGESRMTETYRVMIVGTDPELTEKLSNALKKQQYQLSVISQFSGSHDPVSDFDPDLVILDPSVSGQDSHEWLQRFWETTHTPVFVVSRVSDISIKVLWLEMGADDFLVEPFDIREFIARVHALLRRSQLNAQKSEEESALTVSFPDLEISLRNYIVLYKNEKLPMPPKEIELLYYLASSPGQVFTRKQLLQHIWGYNYAGDTRTVDVHIKRLRRKLPPSEYWSIETVWGVGYKFQPA